MCVCGGGVGGSGGGGGGGGGVCLKGGLEQTIACVVFGKEGWEKGRPEAVFMYEFQDVVVLKKMWKGIHSYN